MNPLTNIKNVTKLSEQELHSNFKTSWHDQYRSSAWIYVGGLPFDLTEGDIICVFSQYGEIVHINLVRDKDSGKSRGFCFICYEDQRSTDLTVDNLNGIKILNRTIRVDHVSEYKVPKEGKKTDAETKQLYQEGCAPNVQSVSVPQIKVETVIPGDIRETLADQISGELRLPPRLPIFPIKIEPVSENEEEKKIKVKKETKNKKAKKEKKHKHKKKKRAHSSSSSSDSNEDDRRSRKSDHHRDNEIKKVERKRHRSRS